MLTKSHTVCTTISRRPVNLYLFSIRWNELVLKQHFYRFWLLYTCVKPRGAPFLKWDNQERYPAHLITDFLFSHYPKLLHWSNVIRSSTQKWMGLSLPFLSFCASQIMTLASINMHQSRWYVLGLILWSQNRQNHHWSKFLWVFGQQRNCRSISWFAKCSFLLLS